MPSQHVLTQEEWVATMAKRAMDRIRSELYLDLRYMNAALGALVPTPAAGLHNLATDGAALCYDPEWFIGLYRSNRRYLPRAVLHSVLRCRAAAGNSLGAKPASACSRQASRPGRLPGPKRCRHRSKQPTAAACTRTFCAALL